VKMLDSPGVDDLGSILIFVFVIRGLTLLTIGLIGAEPVVFVL
jgi:hypothetical protein